jgi:hypothetical protein
MSIASHTTAIPLLNAREERPDMASTLRGRVLRATCVVSMVLSVTSCSKDDDSPPTPRPNPKVYEALADLPTLRVGDSTKFGSTLADARLTIEDIKYLTKIRINSKESVEPVRGLFVRIDVHLSAYSEFSLIGTKYDWTSAQGDELEDISAEAAKAWEYNPLGRSYFGTGWADGTILMDVPKKGGKVTVHLAPEFTVQLPSK